MRELRDSAFHCPLSIVHCQLTREGLVQEGGLEGVEGDEFLVGEVYTE